MAAPNLRSPATVTGKTAMTSVATTLTSVVDNAAASGLLLKLNTIRAANVDSGGAAVALDLTVYRGSTHRYLIKGVSIGTAKALIVSDKNEYVYLEEGDSLYAKATSASGIDLTVNYEEIS
jgi:hypothetical protein